MFVAQIILQCLFHEHAASHWVNSFLVHLLDVLDVGAQRDLVSRCNPANERNQTEMTHLLDGLCHFSMCRSRQARLIPVQNLACLVQELKHHWSVTPVDILLIDTAHVTFSDLRAGHRPVKESSWTLHLVIELFVLLLDDVALGEVTIGLDKRCRIPVLLLVLPGGCQRVFLIFELEVGLRVAKRVINADILS